MAALDTWLDQHRQTRDEVQHRFPPGSMVFVGAGHDARLVIAWFPTTPEFWKSGAQRLISSWTVALVGVDGRVSYVGWIEFRSMVIECVTEKT